MAQTPEQTGNSNHGMLRLKKAAVATYFFFALSHAGNARQLAMFGLIAALVPPPVGLLAATVLVGGYKAAMAAGRSLSHAFRDAKGYAQPGDFEILGEFNRIQREAPRLIVPLPRPEKTVFPRFEIR
jgi:hypothetical protein